MVTTGPFDTDNRSDVLEDLLSFFGQAPAKVTLGDGPAPGTTRCRVAVGVFTAFDQLAPALDELRPAPPHVKLCVVAARSALGNDLAEKYAAADGRPFGLVFVDPDAHDGEDTAEAAPGTGKDCVLLAHLGDSFPPRLAANLKRQLADGACLLFVRIQEPEFEGFACQTLIRHAAGPVQVHDVTL